MDDPADDVAVLTEASGVEHRHRQERHAGVGGARDAEGVIGLCGDDARHCGPVAVRINQSVAAVEHRGAGQDHAVEIAVRAVDSGVEHGHHRRSSGSSTPIQVGPADLSEGPLAGDLRIRRERAGLPCAVLVDADDLGGRPQDIDLAACQPVVQQHAVHRELRNGRDIGDAGRSQDLGLARLRRPRRERDDVGQRAGRQGGRRRSRELGWRWRRWQRRGSRWSRRRRGSRDALDRTRRCRRILRGCRRIRRGWNDGFVVGQGAERRDH